MGFRRRPAPHLVNTDIAIATNSEMMPCVAYYSNSESESPGTVRYAVKGDGGWVSETVAQTDVQYYTDISLLLDSEGKPHIVFYDERESELKHAWLAPPE